MDEGISKYHVKVNKINIPLAALGKNDTVRLSEKDDA